MKTKQTPLKVLASTLTALLLTFSISACSEETPSTANAATNNTPSQAAPSAWGEDSLFVTFSAGANQGRHEYVIGDRTESSIKLYFSKNSGPTGVMGFEALDIVSKDGTLQIGSLKRYTKGDLQIGKNTTSTWKGAPISSGDECDEVSLAVDQGPQYRQKTYGYSTHCNAVEILSMTEWRKSGSIRKERQVTGRFADTVEFKSNSSPPTDATTADILVEFVVTQKELRY